MTLPPVMRIFFALDLPEVEKEKIGHFIAELKKKSKSHGIRWTKPENLHITLQFLAEVQTQHLPQLVANVKAQIAEVTSPLILKWGSIQLFPHPYRPRVIVLELLSQEKLVTLSHLIGQGIIATHYPVDTRPFRGHLTLGRIKYTKGIDLQFLAGTTSFNEQSIEVSAVHLFRSEPQEDGSKYTVLDKISLKS